MNGMYQRPDCSVFHPIWLFHPRRGRQRGLLTLWVVLFPFAKRNARSAIQTVAAANQRPPASASATAQALSSLPFLSPPFHPPPQANDAAFIVAHPSTWRTRPFRSSRPAALPKLGRGQGGHRLARHAAGNASSRRVSVYPGDGAGWRWKACLLARGSGRAYRRRGAAGRSF